MNGALLSVQIQAALAPWNGKQFQPFCSALGNGICTAIIGKLKFETQDLGLVAGAGKGTGLGIKGLNPAQISQLMYSKGQDAWSSQQRDGPGVEWLLFCTKVSTAVVAHFATTAIANSIHTPVAVGTGKVTKYSGVTADDMAGEIVSAAPSDWAKARFPELAMAVATGIMTNVLGHTPVDVQVIAGSPAGIPVPGSGKGQGTIT